MVDMVLCVTDPIYLQIGVDERLSIGANTSQAPGTLRKNFKIDFLDFDFKRPILEKHLELCREIRPKYVCAPDIFSESELDETLDYAAELKKHSENVIIIPKCACIDRIEKKWMVGYSVPTAYGGAEGFTVWDIMDYDIHLLGGSPGQQLKYKKYLKNIKSFDGNSYIKIARQSHQFWRLESPHWVLDGNDTISLIAKSIRNIKTAWGIT